MYAGDRDYSPQLNMEFQDLRLFVSVVDNGSFTKATAQEDLPGSTLSRRLRKLEDELGLRLLERTTRRVQVTDLGMEFYDRRGIIPTSGIILATSTYLSNLQLLCTV